MTKSPKNIAQINISKGISECSALISQPHQEATILEAGKRLLKNLANAGEALNNVIEDQEDVSNILDRLCDRSKDESERIANLLLSIQDYHLVKLGAVASLTSSIGEISKQVIKEAYDAEYIDPEQLKVSIGRAIMSLATLCREHDLKVIDCIMSVTQFDEEY